MSSDSSPWWCASTAGSPERLRTKVTGELAIDQFPVEPIVPPTIDTTLKLGHDSSMRTSSRRRLCESGKRLHRFPRPQAVFCTARSGCESAHSRFRSDLSRPGAPAGCSRYERSPDTAFACALFIYLRGDRNVASSASNGSVFPVKSCARPWDMIQSPTSSGNFAPYCVILSSGSRTDGGSGPFFHFLHSKSVGRLRGAERRLTFFFPFWDYFTILHKKSCNAFWPNCVDSCGPHSSNYRVLARDDKVSLTTARRSLDVPQTLRS